MGRVPRRSTQTLESPPPCYDLLSNKGGGGLKLSKKTIFRHFGDFSLINKGGTQAYGLENKNAG